MVSFSDSVISPKASQLLKNACTNSAQQVDKVSVHKFGGSSLASAQRIRHVADIIAKLSDPNDFIVVSANGKVTDWLTQLVIGNIQILKYIRNFYTALAVELLNNPHDFLTEFNSRIKKLNAISANELCEHQSAQIIALGEYWSAQLLVAYLQECKIASRLIDSQQLLRTSCPDDYQCFDRTYFLRQINRLTYGNFNSRFVMTGFVVSDIQGKALLLGRNGSDFSATLLASLLSARQVTLWTDVNGIYQADPNIIDYAQAIKQLSYEEAQALASLGTNVLHQKTITPLIAEKIPLRVCSSITTAEISAIKKVQGTLVAQCDIETRPKQLNRLKQKNKSVSDVFKSAIKSIAIQANKIILVGKNISSNSEFLLILNTIINELNRQNNSKVSFSIKSSKEQTRRLKNKQHNTENYLLTIYSSLQVQDCVAKANEPVISKGGLELEPSFTNKKNEPLVKAAQLLNDLLVGDFKTLDDFYFKQARLSPAINQQATQQTAVLNAPPQTFRSIGSL
ncbi:amino acid kinase family protein [Aliikangiella sp. IMCC44632]